MWGLQPTTNDLLEVSRICALPVKRLKNRFQCKSPQRCDAPGMGGSILRLLPWLAWLILRFSRTTASSTLTPAPAGPQQITRTLYDSRRALLTLFVDTNGTSWANFTGWPDAAHDLEPFAHFVRQMPAYQWQHCLWYGVYCCGADGTLFDVTQPQHLQYVITNETACLTPGGVAVLLLGRNNLVGDPSAGLTGLSDTLELLNVNGENLVAALG